MLMMKEYVFKCLTCKKTTSTKRSLKCSAPRFCSKKCYRIASPKWLIRKEFHLKTKQEQADHLSKYFDRNVIKTENCWDWKVAKKDKYPRMDYAKKQQRLSIHHYSWKINFGEIPEGMFVCHKCDNTRCSNPLHLFLGTAKDNNKDCNDKGRRPRGDQHAGSKINADQVKQIRKLLNKGITAIRISKDLNVPKDSVYRIKQGKTWKHVI